MAKVRRPRPAARPPRAPSLPPDIKAREAVLKHLVHLRPDLPAAAERAALVKSLLTHAPAEPTDSRRR